ncbi:DNA binding protein, putative isoform 1 [Hibiscus syriacus]|uniref:DNA binding protein, putative isoform 1 n=1 Tax=Hibiscus syriacus TaxID=106335 RepID=A0A6A2ZQ97_HIBSY|nr:uncharacterized protein LOC120140950 [Hibiscus syriacus]KAE8694058.1 DNA binding protein, putative isoform 1 [Hibiscus syriacus]
MLTRNSVSQPTPFRRSGGLLDQKTPRKSKGSNAQNVKSEENTASSTAKISKKPVQSSNVSTNCVSSTSGSRKSPRLNCGSSSNKPEGSKSDETKNVEPRKNESIKVGSLDGNRREMEKKERGISVESERREVSENTKDVGVKRNRKRKREGERKPKDGGDAVLQGWTREQELTLQRAYFSAKPTPNFWKKVSKLVPGKSAQDCFDRIHTNHLTPTPTAPRSKAKRVNLSPIEHLSFSASKLLQSPALSKSSGRGKHKSYLTQKKTVRHLLRKHHLVDEGDEADLFSILEPNTSPSMHVCPNVMFSTPKVSLEKQGVLRKCHERSFSGCKKHRSKLVNSCTEALVSPPVLKQIKNRELHEKYIDQLHNREAKRKAESSQAETVVRKENRGSTQIQVDKIKAAKKALVSDARDVINLLQHLQTTSVDNSLDLEADNTDGDHDEEEEDDINL